MTPKQGFCVDTCIVLPACDDRHADGSTFKEKIQTYYECPSTHEHDIIRECIEFKKKIDFCS